MVNDLILEPISTAYSHGTPRGVLDNVIVPFNDAELASKIIEKRRSGSCNFI